MVPLWACTTGVMAQNKCDFGDAYVFLTAECEAATCREQTGCITGSEPVLRYSTHVVDRRREGCPGPLGTGHDPGHSGPGGEPGEDSGPGEGHGDICAGPGGPPGKGIKFSQSE